MTGIDLSKHQTLDADPRAIQQVIFTGNLEHEIHDDFHYSKSKVYRFGFVT